MTTWLRRAGFAALVCAIAVVSLPSAASAQSQATTPISVELVSQPATVTAGQEMKIELKITGAVDTDAVKLIIYAALNRADLRRLIDDGRTSTVLNMYTDTFKSVYDPVRQTATVTVPALTATRPPGVYPIGIQVGNARSPQLLTTLVRVTDVDPQGGPLNVALVVPVQSPAALQADHSLAIAVSDRNRLDGLATAFGDDYPNLPITFAPNPETLDALDRGGADERGTLAHMKDATAGREIIGTTFVPIDEEAWRSGGLSYRLAGQLKSGLDTLGKTIASGTSKVTTDLALADPTDTPATLDLRRALGVARVVIDEDRLEPLDTTAFPSTLLRTFVVNDTSGAELRAAVSDSRLTRLAGDLTRASSPTRRALLAQQFVADLAAAYFDNPRQTRGAVIKLPDDWAINSTIHDVLIPALSNTPILQPVTLDRFFTTVSRSSPSSAANVPAATTSPLRRVLRPEPVKSLGDYAARLDRATKRVDAFEAILVDKTAAAARTADLRDLLLASADARLQPAQRDEYLAYVDDTVDRLLHASDGGPAIVQPRPQRVTMTSRNAEIPLDLENRLPFAIQIQIQLSSEKLDFPDGYLRTETLAPGPNHFDISIRSRVSGDSLLEVTVVPLDAEAGVASFARARYTIRSTALSGVGFALSMIALLVLIVWWFRHARRTRRHKRRAAADAAVASVDAGAYNRVLVPDTSSLDESALRTEP
ncbi:MAG TPA: DUF6049 family protein [Acidimicrobiales bacterium]|nr:DUF6049 family protein [Acidimicrobiales bacterium]